MRRVITRMKLSELRKVIHQEYRRAALIRREQKEELFILEWNYYDEDMDDDLDIRQIVKDFKSESAKRGLRLEVGKSLEVDGTRIVAIGTKKELVDLAFWAHQEIDGSFQSFSDRDVVEELVPFIKENKRVRETITKKGNYANNRINKRKIFLYNRNIINAKERCLGTNRTKWGHRS